MGSPLGPTFNNFYMSYIEEVIRDGKLKPYKYGRYVDDNFIIVKEQDQLNKIKKFEQKSLLKIIIEKTKIIYYPSEISQ